MTATGPFVLVTGATGFVGSHLVHALVRAGQPVLILKRSTTDTWRIADVVNAVTVHDLDTAPLSAAFSRPIDVVIHMATSYGRNGETDAQVTDVNVSFPTRLLRLAIERNVPVFLNTDTFSTRAAEVSDVLRSYVRTKKQFRESAQGLARGTRTRFVNVQLEHVYGPLDGSAKFVPSLLRALLANEPTFDLTPGEQERDFIYVDDVVAAFMTLVRKHGDLTPADTHFEVGTGTAVPVSTFVRRAQALAESATQLRIGALSYRAAEQMHSCADTAAMRLLGWSPSVSLDDGLTRTIRAQQR